MKNYLVTAAGDRIPVTQELAEAIERAYREPGQRAARSPRGRPSRRYVDMADVCAGRTWPGRDGRDPALEAPSVILDSPPARAGDPVGARVRAVEAWARGPKS
jgi:hypothetical protein